MSGDRKPNGLTGTAMLDAGFRSLVENAVKPAQARALAAITKAAEEGRARLAEKANKDGEKIVGERMADLRARSSQFIDETFGGSATMLREAVAGVMATAQRAETQAGIAAREAAAAQKIQRETATAQGKFMTKVLGAITENRAADSARATRFEGTLLNRLREQDGKIANAGATAVRAEATADGANTVAVNANKIALDAKRDATKAVEGTQRAERVAENNRTTLTKLGEELKDLISTKADHVLAKANERIDARLARLLRGNVATLGVDATGKVSVTTQYLEGEAFTAALVKNGEATVAAAQMLLAANEALAKEARDLRRKNKDLEVELAKFGHKPEVESRLQEVERALAEGILTATPVAAEISEMLVEVGGEKVKLGVLLASIQDTLKAINERRAVDAAGAAAVEDHERKAKTSDRPVITEEARKAEMKAILGKLAEAITEEAESAVFRGLVGIANEHLNGVEAVIDSVGAKKGNLKDSDSLKELLGRAMSAVYGIDYENLDAETSEKLNAKVTRAVAILEKFLEFESTGKVEIHAQELEREEQQLQSINERVAKFMEKLTELVVALNEQSIGDDEFGTRVTELPKITKLDQLDAELVQARLVEVAQLIGDEVVVKVKEPLKLGANGDLVTSLESELKVRLEIIANATKGVVSDQKIAEIVSW